MKVECIMLESDVTAENMKQYKELFDFRLIPISYYIRTENNL